MKEPKILIWCKAFNTEKVVKRAIDSVLNQTYKNWTLCLIDNGSTDKTKDIIPEYGKADERIKTFCNEKNNVWKKEHTLNFNIHNSTDCDYVCILDSDDELHPQFLEKMLDFATQNNLDTVICGIEYIDSATNKTMGLRALKENLIIQGLEFENQFYLYQEYIRAMWGKLYSRNILVEKYKKYKKAYTGFGGDTIYVLQYLGLCSNFGIINKPLYKWYQYPKSHTFTFSPVRLVSSEKLRSAYIEFIKTKCGRVNRDNKDVINLIYLANIIDVIELITKTNISHLEKLEHFYTILKSRTIAAVFADLSRLNIEQKKHFIIEDMFKKLQIKHFSKHTEICLKIVTELQSLNDFRFAMLAKYPLLKNLSNKLALTLKNPVLLTIKNDYKQALEALIAIKDTEIADSDKEAYLMLGINLSAFAENTNTFVDFKKKFIAYLIASGRNEEASIEQEQVDKVNAALNRN